MKDKSLKFIFNSQVTEVTMVAGADAADAYTTALEAINDPVC